MEIFESNYKPQNSRGCVLALGNFDGVHKGHVHLMNRAKEYAKNNNLLFGVYTFTDSPKFANACHSILTTTQERLSYIGEKVSPDFVYLEKFDDVKSLSPAEFVDYIIGKFSCECTFCGENFSFGNKAEGKAGDLQILMKQKGKEAHIVESLTDETKVVSSTLIKSLLAEGNAKKAQELLGSPFGFTAKIVHGAHLGHKLGFPTINQIIPTPQVLPKFGVYSTVVIIDGKEYMGVTNFGVKPTVSSDGTPVAETYIIDFDGDVYEKYAGIYFLNMLREEKKFESLDELIENIRLNVEQTRVFFKEKYEKN